MMNMSEENTEVEEQIEETQTKTVKPISKKKPPKSVDISNCFSKDPVTLSKDPFLCTVWSFEGWRIDVGRPNKTKSKGEQPVEYASALLNYKYPKPGSNNPKEYVVAPLQVELPETSSKYGIKMYVNDGGRVSYSMGFSIDTTSEWGRKYVDVVDAIYQAIMVARCDTSTKSSTYYDILEMNGYSNKTVPNLKVERDWKTSPWEGLDYPMKFKHEGGVIDYGFKPYMTCRVIKDGKFATKFLAVLPGSDPENPLIKLVDWDFMIQVGPNGIPCIGFLDYFIGARNKIRTAVVSMIITGAQLKTEPVVQGTAIRDVAAKQAELNDNALEEQFRALRAVGCGDPGNSPPLPKDIQTAQETVGKVIQEEKRFNDAEMETRNNYRRGEQGQRRRKRTPTPPPSKKKQTTRKKLESSEGSSEEYESLEETDDQSSEEELSRKKSTKKGAKASKINGRK